MQQRRVDLLIPVVKAWSTDAGVEIASIGMQVHGGMGYIEETGAAQHLRDARIAPIYEGTNGIQAIDLVTRKLPLSGGGTVGAVIDGLRATVANLEASNDAELAALANGLRESVDTLARSTAWLLQKTSSDPQAALAGATPYLRLFALATGGCALAEEAIGARHAPGESVQAAAARLELA